MLNKAKRALRRAGYAVLGKRARQRRHAGLTAAAAASFARGGASRYDTDRPH